ncbi:MAG TPA: nitrous oxide reductase family maturation protein NosD [Flavobacteriales bacterium]|jgi:nitrous oxidase accessory protein|nr:nitrous oxide reductase family maturation protein NosD [Flavobacteriales bacterium]HOY27608.1 nitrous oxide reductase family maturation protein NosD [Flavobacteriales bacterium]
MRELLILLLACLSVTHVGARTWRYRSGAGASLQTVINGTAAGDTVLVEGTVSEGSIRVDRPLVLLGGADAVIDGGGEDDALLITADHVTVKGFTIRGSRRSNLDDMSGIKVNECRGVVIEDNFLDKCFFAIYLSGVKDARVQGNTVLGEPGAEDFMANGIHLWKCSNATIRNNRIENHRDGIYFEFVTDSHIIGNTSLHNLRYGLHFMFSHRDAYEDNHFEDNGAGVAVMFSKEIAMRRNHFLANRGASAYGLLLKEINDGEIIGNTFQDNTTGIMIDGCNRINVRDNEFRLNGWALRLFANAIDCDFRGNTFAGNTFDVSTNGSLIPNTMNGNYWDRYAGYDLDRDGHGDVPHRPLGFFTLLVEMQPYAMVFSRSLFVSLLDRAERLIPSLTPESMKDDRPLMRPPVRKNRAVAVANKRLFPHSAFVIFHSSFFIPAGMGLNEKWRTSEHSVVLVHPFIFPLGGRYYDHG